MRLISLALLALGLLCGYLAYQMLSIDLTTLTEDGRLGLQLAFNALAGSALGLPILAAIALNDDANMRRRSHYRRPRKARRG